MKLEFSLQIFEKYSYIKFNESPTSGSRGVQRGQAGGQTDRLTYRDDANSRFSQFCERV